MALKIQSANTFDASQVVFSTVRKNKHGGKVVYLSGPNNSKLYLELPFMRAPFGLSLFSDKETGRPSYSLPISFDKTDNEILKLQEIFKKFDETVIQTVADNSAEWLGKPFTAAVLEQALYRPLIRPGKGDYSATMKLSVFFDAKNNKFISEAYNSARSQVPLDSIEKGQSVKCIIDINSISFIDGKFGVGIRLQQVLLAPSKKLPAFAFQDVPSSECEDEQDYVDE